MAANSDSEKDKMLRPFEIDFDAITDKRELKRVFEEQLGLMVEEQTKILSFSNLIASAIDKKILGKIIGRHLKEIFGIYEYSIYINSRDGKWSWPFIFDTDSAIAQHEQFQEWIETPLDLNDELHQVAKNLKGVMLLDKEQYLALPGVAKYRDMVEAIGMKGWGISRIDLADELVAILTFHHHNIREMEPKLELFKSICAQLGISASNILSREELERREQEKSILLSLSNEIASLRNRSDLFDAVNAKLKEIFSVTNFGIIKVDEDGSTHSIFMMDVALNDPAGQQELDKVKRAKYRIDTDKAFHSILHSEGPIVLDLQQFLGFPETPDYVSVFVKFGLDKLLCVALKSGGNPIGAMFMSQKRKRPLFEAEEHLLKGISSQLSVAVANMLANEKVLYQLTEIDKYKQQLENEKVYLQEEIKTFNNSTDFIGSSNEMKKILRLVSTVSKSDSTVLILGETGTGKELVARAIHNESSRRNKLMVKVNCAVLPANLIESELFGHERGSFTGAIDRRIGKFELANNGTLFLDEIGELPLDVQGKLLRVLQEKEIERIGGKATIKIHVRIIAATNRNLEKEMQVGNFRSDLFYRLNIFPINLPPLRARSEDIPELTSYFISKYAKKMGRSHLTTTKNVMLELQRYTWPGNVRELEHLIERCVLLEAGEVIRQVHLPIPKSAKREDGDSVFKLTTIDENERQHIFDTLKYCNGRITGPGGAAEILNVPPSTLHSKMKRLGIVRKHVK